jgi:hypothetical protein
MKQRLAVTLDNAGREQPTRGTGNDAVAIQAAIDRVLARGGGAVDLGAFSWTCGSQIRLDPTRCSLIGDGAKLDFTSAGAIDCLLVQAPLTGGATQYGHGTQSIRGVRFRGNSNQNGITLYTETNGSDLSSRITLRELDITGFGKGIRVRQNAFIIKGFSLDVYACTTCLYIENETNRAENMNFHGCTFFNSTNAFWFTGSNQDAFFFGCSFDYCTIFGYTDSLLEFHGCHFEKQPPQANERPFQVDNGGAMKFFGGGVSYSAGTVNADYSFMVWGQGGSFILRDTLYTTTGYGTSGISNATNTGNSWFVSTFR